MTYILLTLLFCTIPAGVIWLCRRYAWLDKIGPIMVLYAIGMVVGNLPLLPEQMKVLQEMIPNVVIPLAIPMMLFGCAFSSKELGLQVKLVVSGFLSVAVAVVGGYLLFGRHLSQGAEVGGIISGVYTGGTVNGAALQAIFGVESQTFVLINSYDIIISFFYFIFLFSVGIRMFRRLFYTMLCKSSDILTIVGYQSITRWCTKLDFFVHRNRFDYFKGKAVSICSVF